MILWTNFNEYTSAISKSTYNSTIKLKIFTDRIYNFYKYIYIQLAVTSSIKNWIENKNDSFLILHIAEQVSSDVLKYKACHSHRQKTVYIKIWFFHVLNTFDTKGFINGCRFGAQKSHK